MKTKIQQAFTSQNVFKLATLFSLILILSVFGYNYVSSQAIQNSVKIQLITGSANINTASRQTELNKQLSYNFIKVDTLVLQKDSVAIIVFKNGRVQSFSNQISLNFVNAERNGSNFSYKFENIETKEAFNYNENFGLSESTATVLGLLDGSQSSTTNLGNVLGVSETEALNWQEKEDKFNTLTSCMENTSQIKTSYEVKIKNCMEKIQIKNLDDLR